MNILKQLGIIFLFGLAGEIVSRYLPVTVPASVIGMVLLFLALLVKILKPESIYSVSDFLSANMGFFFLPPAVAIVKSYETVRPVMFKLIVICILSTFITFLVSYATVRVMQIIFSKKVKPQIKD